MVGPSSRVSTCIDLVGCVDITDDGLAVLPASAAELVSLDLSFCELITDGGLEQISLECQMLESPLYEDDNQ